MSASSSYRTRASNLRKLLPKKPSLRSKTVVNLFLNACNDPNTKDFIMDEMSTNPKLKNSLSAVTNKLSEESKIVHKNIRRAYALKSKGFKKQNSLQRIVTSIRSKYSIRQVQSITGMTYRQVYRLIGPPKVSSSKRSVTSKDRLYIYNMVLRTTHSMQIPYRRFTKYFYLRESLHTTYLAYVKEQKQLGARILQESTWYKYLPKNLRSQKYIPFMECLCVKCLNFSLIIDALSALDITVHRRSILNVVASICPFLVHKSDLDEFPEKSSPASLVQPSVKATSIKFGHTELAEFDYETIKINRKGLQDISNVKQPEIKHDPDKFLITERNVPEKIRTETVIINSSPNCIMRNCNQCGIHKLYETIVRDNPHICDKYNEKVIWYKWSSPVEVINGKEYK